MPSVSIIGLKIKRREEWAKQNNNNNTTVPAETIQSNTQKTRKKKTP
jgi:hypothetical protein